MSAAAVLAVIVAAGEAHTPVTEALVSAAAEAVGAAATVKVAETASHSDRAVLRLEAALDALAAVSLVWDDDQHLRAHTRLHVVRSDRWIDRAIGFEPADKLSERGRALGFTIASMLPEAGSDIEITLPDSFATREGPRNHALQVSVLGTGLGSAPDLGGAIAGERLVAENVALRVGLSYRQGMLLNSDQGFSATKYVGGLAAGVSWWLLFPGPEGRFGGGLRADLLGLRVQVIRDAAGDQLETETGGGFVLGADLMAQGTIRVTANAEVAIGLGGEWMSRGVDVRLRSPGGSAVDVASIPAWRAVAEVGMRFLF